MEHNQDKVQSTVIGDDVTSHINLEAVYHIPLKVMVVLGSTELKVNQILKLTKGAIVELDKKVGDPVDLYVGDRLVARGEIVLVDNKVGVTLTELAKPDLIEQTINVCVRMDRGESYGLTEAVGVQDLYCTSSRAMSAGSVVALGNFDGVHLGHQEVLKTCVLKARQYKLEPIAISFRPHPGFVLSKKHHLIIPYDQKISWIKSIGITKIIEVRFDAKMAEVPHNDFVVNLLVKKLNVRKVVTGADFCYGHDRNGNIETLHTTSKKHCFEHTVVNRIFIGGKAVSSSLIKEQLKKGLIEQTNSMLGRRYILSDMVIRGNKLASSALNFPTANFLLHDTLVDVMHGVYLSRITINNRSYFGLTNIGIKPTLSTNSERTAETHIFDFNENVYDQTIAVELLSFMRPERKFQSLAQLQKQISIDCDLGLHLLKFHPSHRL